eukprot:9361461-Pyramimonas_sp.AAC.1
MAIMGPETLLHESSSSGAANESQASRRTLKGRARVSCLSCVAYASLVYPTAGATAPSHEGS